MTQLLLSSPRYPSFSLWNVEPVGHVITNGWRHTNCLCSSDPKATPRSRTNVWHPSENPPFLQRNWAWAWPWVLKTGRAPWGSTQSWKAVACAVRRGDLMAGLTQHFSHTTFNYSSTLTNANSLSSPASCSFRFPFLSRPFLLFCHWVCHHFQVPGQRRGIYFTHVLLFIVYHRCPVAIPPLSPIYQIFATSI